MGTFRDYIDDDYAVFDETETVSLYDRSGTLLGTATYALRRIMVDADQSFGDVSGPVGSVRWHIWVNDIGSGVRPPHDGYITDAEGNNWIIDSIEFNTLRTRWTLETTLQGGQDLEPPA